MFPRQSSAQPQVKSQQMDSEDYKNTFIPQNYPCFLSIPPIFTHELYILVKGQIQEYERTHGIGIQQKCCCKHKTRKRGKKQGLLLKKQNFDQDNQHFDTEAQKNETSEQKQGRNVNSNLLRMFFRRLEHKIQNQSQFLEVILRKIGSQISLDDFESWIRNEKVDYRNYIRIPNIKKLFCNSISPHSKALRIIFKNFLDEESVCCYLTSRKIKKDAMKLNLSAVRTIFNEFRSITI